MTGRSRAREVAMQLLYGEDLNPLRDSGPVEEFINSRIPDPRLRLFARDLVAGVHTKRVQLDGLISEIAENWKLARMSPIDRNILRLGAYELLFTDVPPKAAIDEAIKLAKRYGTGQSSQFVNGILDRVLAFREQEREEGER
jgi:N utilization substance protein B